MEETMIESKPIDLHGRCPNKECNDNWDGGDILEQLGKIEAYSSMGYNDLVKLAEQSYGYTQENKKRFSRTIAIRFVPSVAKDSYNEYLHTAEAASSMKNSPDYIQCPKCRKVYDIKTGEEFNSIPEAKSAFMGIDIPRRKVEEERKRLERIQAKMDTPISKLQDDIDIG
jgi:hypothetical protein